MPTLIAIGAIVSALLVVGGLIRRRRRGRRITSAYTMELAFDSIQLGAVLAAVAYPTLYLLFSIARHGGSIAQNLPQGVQEDFVLGILLVGATASVIYTLFNYLKHS